MDSDFDSLTLDDALRRIERTMRTARADVPFTLIAGAGLSVPVIPTASQMVKDIPRWLRDCEGEKRHLKEYRRDFWAALNKRDGELVLTGSGLPDDGLPGNIGRAYQLAMSHELISPHLRCRYIQETVDRSGESINPAHLFLASILAAQDTAEWKFRAPFCRTVFTTNFDPLLQRALQLVGGLYYISDRPTKLDVPFDLQHSGVHLVYSHGSLFQYRLANTEHEIKRFAKEQSSKLPDYLEKHGVIVVGYSGWQDSCIQALSECQQFGNNLYWFDIHVPGECRSRLSPAALELLSKHRSNAFYVPVTGADDLFQTLHQLFGLGEVPSIVGDPVAVLERRLASIKGISPTSLESVGSTPKRHLDTLRAVSEFASSPEADVAALDRIVRDHRMNAAIEEADNEQYDEALQSLTVLLSDDGIQFVEQFEILRIRSDIWELAGETAEAIADLSAALSIPKLSEEQLTDTLLRRSELYVEAEDVESAIADATSVITTAEDVEVRCHGRHQRAIILGNAGRYEESLRDLNAVIDDPDAPQDSVALAYGERALAWQKLGMPERSLADFDAALAAKEFDHAIVVQAHFFRAQQYEESEEWERAIDDFTEVIESPDAERNYILSSLELRAECKAELGDEEGAKADYAKFARLNREADEEGLVAMMNRAACHALGENFEEAIQDYSAILELPESQDDPHVQGQCRLQRAANLQEVGRLEEALRDLNTVLDDAGIPFERLTLACGLRGVLHAEMGNDTEAIRDFLTTEEHGDAHPHMRWNSRIQRAVAMARDPASVQDALELLGGMRTADVPESQQFEACVVRTRILLLEENMREAEKAAAEAILLLPHCDTGEEGTLFWFYAMALAENDKLDEAIDAIREGLQFATNDDLGNLLFLEAKCLVALGRNSEALTKIEDAIPHTSDDDDHLRLELLKLRTLVTTEEFESAAELGRKLVRETTEDTQSASRVMLGVSLLRLGRDEEAKSELLIGAHDESASAAHQLHLAVAYARSGDIDSAVNAIRRCVAQLDSRDDSDRCLQQLESLKVEHEDLSVLIEIVQARLSDF